MEMLNSNYKDFYKDYEYCYKEACSLLKGGQQNIAVSYLQRMGADSETAEKAVEQAIADLTPQGPFFIPVGVMNSDWHQVWRAVLRTEGGKHTPWFDLGTGKNNVAEVREGDIILEGKREYSYAPLRTVKICNFHTGYDGVIAETEEVCISLSDEALTRLKSRLAVIPRCGRIIRMTNKTFRAISTLTHREREKVFFP